MAAPSEHCANIVMSVSVELLAMMTPVELMNITCAGIKPSTPVSVR